MEIEALLCDAVTVREGLLHVLGGGANTLWREAYPAPLGVDLGLLLTLHPSEATEAHHVRIILQDEDGKVVAQLDAEFTINQPATEPAVRPGQMLYVPLAIPLRNVPIPNAGSYSVELLVDKQHRRSLPVTAMPAGTTPQAQLPPT